MRPKCWRETWIRALRTFLQAFVGYVATNFAISPANLTDNDSFMKWAIGFVGAAIAAAVATVMNLPKKGE